MAGWKARLFWAVVLAGCLAAITTARLLEPDARGYGTHTQITGMPCLFRSMCDLPCPVCGMTTSFAYAARLQVLMAFYAQPFGVVLFVLVIAAAVLAVRGLAVGRLRIKAPPGWIVLSIAACLILAWVYKILIYRGNMR